MELGIDARSSVAPFGSNPRLRAGLPQLAACLMCRDDAYGLQVHPIASLGSREEAEAVAIDARAGSPVHGVCTHCMAHGTLS